MKHLKILFLLMFATSLYSMDSDNIDHQRTPQERTLRVERINAYFKGIIENEDSINSYKNVINSLEYAKKIAHISLKYLDVYKQDLVNIENSLLTVQKDFKSLFYSDDLKIKKFKETIQILHLHVSEESSTLAFEGCTSSTVDVHLPADYKKFVSIKAQSLDFSSLYLDSFQNVANGYANLNDKIFNLHSIRENIDVLYTANSGSIKMIESYLSWNNSQIEVLKTNKKEKIRLMHKNLDWFDVD